MVVHALPRLLCESRVGLCRCWAAGEHKLPQIWLWCHMHAGDLASPTKICHYVHSGLAVPCHLEMKS